MLKTAFIMYHVTYESKWLLIVNKTSTTTTTTTTTTSNIMGKEVVFIHSQMP